MRAALILALLAGETLRPGIAVKDESVSKGQATTVNCTGAGVTCSVGVGGVWTLNATGGAGGGAPTTVPYWTGAADATLSAEHNLGALATGLVLNTAGTPSAYGGATCTAPNFIRVLSASGAATCAAPTLRLDQLTNPTGDSAFTYPTGTKLLWTFTGSTDEAFTINGDGAFVGTGDLVHIHKSGTGSSAGADALHVEVDADLNMTGLRITMANGTRTALSTNALVTAAGFSGPLTGSVTGTASALAADGANCSAGQAPLGVDASGAVQGCFTPAGTYTLPAASTTLGGVKMAAACAAGNHVSSIGAGGELACTADAGGAGGSPGGSTTQVQYNNAGSFGGITGLLSDGAYMMHVATTTHPAAPSAGQVKQYAFQHHGSTAPAIPQFVDGDAQMEMHQFPFTASFDYRWGCLTPAGGGNALLAASGFAPPSGNTTGTAAAVAWASTDERTRHAWVQYPSATTASSSAGVRANADVMWRGNAAGLGGWYWWAAVNIVTTTANQRVFMGLKDSTAVITATTNPSASLDTVYFGCDAAQTTLRICSNDNAGAATCADLGANFPCTTANIAYDVALWAAPNGSSIGYYIRRLVGGQTASGTLSSDLPRNTVALGWDLWINNGGTAAASTMQFGGTCYIANP